MSPQLPINMGWEMWIKETSAQRWVEKEEERIISFLTPFPVHFSALNPTSAGSGIDVGTLTT